MRQKPMQLAETMPIDWHSPSVNALLLSAAGKFTATDVFDDRARLAQLAARARTEMSKLDLLLVPTALENYLIDEINDTEAAAAPTWPLNAKNGRFTNFVNLLDMCGIAIPSGMLRVDYSTAQAAAGTGATRAAHLAASGGPQAVALPFGVTLLAGAWRDEWLWGIAERLEAAAGLTCGPEGHGVTPVVV